jgi:predicted nucleotide-binding protein
MAIHLEPEQKQLFATLRDAVKSQPREQREEFMFLRTFGGDSIQGNGLELDVLFEDVIALDDAGLIRVTNHHKKGSGLNFVIPTSAAARFEQYEAGEAVPEPIEAEEPADKEADPKAVMVVHGRNSEARKAMFAFIKRLGLKPLEWNDLIAGTGKAAPYVGEILNHAFSRAKAVLVLFTPDDEARLRDELQDPDDESYETNLTPQARPNVLFEAGMAMARRENGTVLVELGRLRPFSDLYGRHVVRINGTEQRLRDIAERLRTAGCAVEPTDDDWADPAQFPDAEPVRSAPAQASASAIEREVGYLNEDARRWIADRDGVLAAESRERSGQMNAEGQLYSGAHLSGLMILRRNALHEYRDEMTRKRRRYAELLDQAPPDAEVPRFALDEGSLDTLARWRSHVTIAGMPDQLAVDDPTDPSREADLRRFEQEGDGPGDSIA